MLEIFYPDHRYASAYDIDYREFYRKGKRGIIFDIDNTLVMHGAPADKRAVNLVGYLHAAGFECAVVSNNKRERVESFATDSGMDHFVYKAGKPLGKGYLEAAKLMGLDLSRILYVGDQIFTDVWGAKRIGIETALVDPIDPREEIQIVLKRYLEKPVLYFYDKDLLKRRLK
ncbi:MAG: HAD-IIIA family hydrolase [Lachnospiraceae bacterium]|nr:HAD-IIIA family hydrolase [Lachnospiraceae bacterium]